MEKGDKVYSMWMTDTFSYGKFSFWVDEYEVFDPAPAGIAHVILRVAGRDHITSRAPTEIYPSREAAHAAVIAMLEERIQKIQAQIAEIHQKDAEAARAAAATPTEAVA